jgi:hypothetical protein
MPSVRTAKSSPKNIYYSVLHAATFHLQAPPLPSPSAEALSRPLNPLLLTSFLISFLMCTTECLDVDDYKVRRMGEAESYLHSFLTLSLKGGEWLTNVAKPLYLRGMNPGTQWIGVWVNPRAGLDVSDRERF